MRAAASSPATSGVRCIPFVTPDTPIVAARRSHAGSQPQDHLATVCPWLTGELAALTPVDDLGRAATNLARFVAALQAMDPAGGLVHEFRGVSLAAYDHNAKAAAAVLQRSFDVGPLLDAWESSVASPAWTGQPLWIHGDLHPANILVRNQELSAVIDFGLLGVGDPACDLIGRLDVPVGRLT
jgi:aminoglycoside phosphotransferase (APT) family kinase protein